MDLGNRDSPPLRILQGLRAAPKMIWAKPATSQPHKLLDTALLRPVMLQRERAARIRPGPHPSRPARLGLDVHGLATLARAGALSEHMAGGWGSMFQHGCRMQDGPGGDRYQP